MAKKKPNLDDTLITVDFIIVVVLLAFTCFWAWREFKTSPPYVNPELYPLKGIDISAHNGMINMDAVRRDGISFVFIKASEGATFQDPNFRLNYDKARRAGLRIGAYHFFRFNVDGVEQAINLLRTVGNRELELGVAIDVEAHRNATGVSTEDIQERLQVMTEYLNLKGYRVTFYSNREGYYEYLHEVFEGFPLWICSFSSTPINADWTFWQYSHHGRVKGIKGDVDLNTFNGNADDMARFCSGNSL